VSRFAGRAGWRRRAVVLGGLGGLIMPLAVALPASAAPTYTVTATVDVGNGPDAVAVNPTTDTIYVANGDGTLSVIDGATNDVTSVTLGGYLSGVAVDPSTNTVYVADSTDNQLYVVNGSTNAVSTIAVGSGPDAVAVDPATDTVYTTNGGDDSVSVVRAATDSVATISDVGDSPNAVAVDPTTDTIYVTNNTDGGTLDVISGASDTITATNDNVGPKASGVAVDPVTDTIYVTDQAVNDLSVIDGTTNQITTNVPIGSKPIGVAVDAATDTIYTTGQDETGLDVVDGTSDAVTNVPTGATNVPVAVDVDPSTGTAYAANYAMDSVTVVSSSGQAGTGSCSTGGAQCAMNGTAVISGGSLSLKAPGGVSWSDQLTGVDQQVASGPVSSSDVYTVTDSTGTAAGWSVNVSATPFTGTDSTPDTNTLPGTMVFDASDSSPNATIALDSACATGSTCTEPVTSVSLPQSFTAGAAVPTQLVNAGAGSGMGSIVLGASNPATFWLSIPSNAVADTYDSTITLSVSSGPA
jgi:YVTN family beta-propeller protein